MKLDEAEVGNKVTVKKVIATENKYISFEPGDIAIITETKIKYPEKRKSCNYFMKVNLSKGDKNFNLAVDYKDITKVKFINIFHKN